MATKFEIDQASIIDNDVEKQVEFTAEVDGDERDFAVKYAVLKELSGDEPEDDALEMFERFSDEIADAAPGAANRQPSANVVIIDASDLE